MDSWKLYTPEGVNDILAEECNAKRIVENTALGVFKSYGYMEVQTPTIEFYDVFNSVAAIKQERMFKLFDNEGRILALRYDITTPIARMVGTKLRDEPLPLRYCYVGNAFRYDGTYQRSTQREFTQAGIEFLGTNNAEADAEVIAVTINTLLEVGLSEFQIDIGQVRFFKGLIGQAKLDAATANSLCDLINKKDALGLETFVLDIEIDEYTKNLIVNLPHYFGDIDLIDKIDVKGLNAESKDALLNIKEVYDILKDYKLEKYVSIDLAMLQSIDYYTGIIFKGFTHGLGTPICGGGRYDNLISTFGKPMPATGVAFGIDRLLSALYRQDNTFEAPKVDALIYNEPGAREAAINVAMGLRKQGIRVERFVGVADANDVKKYAQAKNIEGIVSVAENGEIMLDNLIDGTTVKTTMTELLGGEDR